MVVESLPERLGVDEGLARRIFCDLVSRHTDVAEALKELARVDVDEKHKLYVAYLVGRLADYIEEVRKLCSQKTS